MSVDDLALPIEMKELQRILREHGVISAQLFGSYARGEQTETSDLDLLVKMEDGRDLWDLGGLQYDLSERLGKKVDIATKLNKHFEPYITPDLIKIL